MTNYAKAVYGYNNSWTVRSHDFWAEEINKAWAGMTNEEKMAEPYVMDHHFKELVEKGLWKPVEKKALPPPDQDIAKGFTPAEEGAQAIEWLRQRVRHLENQLTWKDTEYAKLNEIYTKLADCWNAFQATTKPLQRDVHRAEAAGEMARRLAELILRVVYHTGRWEDILAILNSLSVEDPVKEPQDTPPLLPRWK